MQPGEFLRYLWHGARTAGAATIWIKQGKTSLHVPLDAVFDEWADGDDADLLKLIGQRDAYTSPGLRELGLPEERQGGRRQVVALAGFVLDVDRADPVAHKAKNLPVTDEDMAEIFSAGPDPTLVVSSGYGLQAWWLFERPWELEGHADQVRAGRRYESFVAPFIAHANQRGWHLDKTASISHLFRLPGSQNWKRETPRPVEVVYEGGARYPLEELTKSTARTRIAHDAEDPEPGLISDTPERSPEELAAKLEQVRAALRRLPPQHEYKEPIEKLLAGESFAARGNRDNMLQRLVWVVAFRAPRDLDADELAEIFRPSLTVWTEEDGAEKTIDEEMAKAEDKLERAFEIRAEKDAKKQAGIEALRNFIRSDGKEVNEDEAPPTILQQYAIVQYKGSYWAQSFGKQSQYPLKPGFYGPFMSNELLVQLGSLWENGPAQFQLTYLNSKDEEKLKTVGRVAQEYAIGAHRVVGHFELQDSYYDVTTRTFHEAICPVREFEPRFDPRIDEWLRVMGGDKADKLLDWIAGVTKLSDQCCALYLSGPPSCGKNLLADGLAQLWHEGGPTQLETVMGDHNAELFRCPLVLLDEGLDSRSRKSASAFLRRLTGNSVFTFNEKYEPTRKVVGCVRLLIAANNDNVLRFGDEELSALDLEAVIGRFLHLRVSRDASAWLEERNPGRSMTNDWVAGGLIARHALWLRENRQFSHGRRFLVEGEATEMHKNMITRGQRNGLVLEWLSRYMSNPDALERRQAAGAVKMPRIRLGNQKLLVNTQGLIDAWATYLGSDTPKLTSQAIGHSLNQLSTGSKPKLGPRGARVQFHEIDVSLVFSWAEQNQIGDLDAMQDNIGRVLAEPEEPPPAAGNGYDHSEAA